MQPQAGKRRCMRKPEARHPERRPLRRSAQRLPLAARRGSAGGGLSWQTMLADLALILFMVTAAAMGQSPRGTASHAPTALVQPPATRPMGEPVAVWRAGPGAPSLSQWLADQQADPRLALTITALYAPGGQVAALAQAASLSREAGAMGRTARIVVDAAPAGEATGAEASLAYDQVVYDQVAHDQAANPPIDKAASASGT